MISEELKKEHLVINAADMTDLDPKPQNSGRRPLVTEWDMNLIVSKIKEVPDITLREMIEEFKLPLSESALSKRLKKLDYTYKKRHRIPLRNNEKI